MLTEIEKKIISFIQDDLTITERPYLELARKVSISEEMFLDTLKHLCDRGVIRRFGATLRHQKSGYTANVMAAWMVEEDRIDEVGKKMAGFRQVSHCYRRNPAKDWPYNLYTMIHAGDERTCIKIVEEISKKTGINTYALLFSKKELKKTSMKYFDSDLSE
jgi:DNA-binding Lrp family transcriptional regulator